MNLLEKSKRKHLLNQNMMCHIDREESKLPWRNSQKRQYEEKKKILQKDLFIYLFLDHNVFI